MRTADTSLDAFASLIDSSSIGRQQAKILDYLSTTGASLTRAEISAYTGIKINAVCPRVRELLDCKPPLLEELPRRPCPVGDGHRAAHPVRVAA